MTAPYVSAPGVQVPSWGINDLDLLTGEQVVAHYNLAVRRHGTTTGGHLVVAAQPMSNSKRIMGYLAQTGRHPAPGEADITALTPAQRRRTIKKTCSLAQRGRS